MSQPRLPMVVSFILLIFTGAIAQTPSQPSAPATASIEGTVTKAESTDPLKGVTVTATPESGIAKKSTSDAEGKFAIRDLAAGRYVLSTARTGYAKPRRGGGPTNVSVIAGQSVTGVKLQMAATAVITGKVLDENSNPLNGKTVYVVSPRYDMGRRMLNPSPSSTAGLSARTDERGEYRLYGIEAGEYYVVTSGDHGLNRFYPSASDPADAVLLVLRPGSETSGIDIHINPIPLYVVRMKSATPIDGIGVAGSSLITFSVFGSSNLQLNRRSRDGWDIRNVVPYGIGFGRSTDGNIESPGLPLGPYELFIGGATFNSGSSHIAFDITNHDVDLGTLTAQRLLPLAGRVEPITGANFDAMRVTLTPIDGHDRLLTSVINTAARIAPDGTFKFTNSLLSQSGGDPAGSVGDGIYQVGLSGLPENMYIASARYATRAALDSGLHIEGNPSGPLDITIGIGGTVRGVVQKGKDKVQDSLVALIPSANHRGNLNLYKTATTDQNGTFTVRGVAPGDYEIVTFLGEDREKVIVTYANNEVFNPHPANVGTNELAGTFPSRRATFMADNSQGIQLVNFSIRNPSNGQAEGLLMMGSRNIVSDVDIAGSGDALQLNGSSYLKDCLVEGAGDTILGRGPEFIDHCELHSRGPYMWIRNTSANHGKFF